MIEYSLFEHIMSNSNVTKILASYSSSAHSWSGQTLIDCLLIISSSGVRCFPVVDHPRGVEVGDPVEVRVQDVDLESISTINLCVGCSKKLEILSFKINCKRSSFLEQLAK